MHSNLQFDTLLTTPVATRTALKVPIVSLILFAAVAVLDYCVGKEINLWILYLVPILSAALGSGLVAGIALAALAGSALFVNGMLLGHPYSSNAIFILDRASDVLAMLLVAVLASVARHQYASFKSAVANAPNLPD